MKDNINVNKTVDDKKSLNSDDSVNFGKKFDKKNKNKNQIDVIEPISFEFVQKVDLANYYDNNYNSSCKIIHELSNEKLGILFDNKLIVISTKTFKEIKIIKPSYDELNSNREISGNKLLVDFKELKNSGIVLWTSNVILFYDVEYNLFQRVDETEHGDLCQRLEYDYGPVFYYDINSIYELNDGKLVSCNSYGLKFYEKNKDKYLLISTEKMEIDVHFVIEIKPNLLILLQKHYDESFGDMKGDDNFLISIYDIENKSLKKIFESQVESMLGEFQKVNYIMSNKYLFMCYGKAMGIFDLEKNMQMINIENDNIYEYERVFGIHQKIMREEKRITKVLANYSDTLFFGIDKTGLKMFMFKNNTLKVYYNFFINNIVGVNILKNNDFIFYSYDCKLYRFTPIFSK